jgi:hypothetical protein
MDSTTHEPQPPLTPTLPIIRHDGWTGEKMAIFCETLAGTAIVADACDAAGMGTSGAYAARRRNPIFAAAWEAALSIARERLADTLLARSIEGNIELIYKDGELVGERHVIDNRLGLAVLRRLDRLAETGLALHSNPPPSAGGRPKGAKGSAPAIMPRPQSVDWEMAVDALREGDHDMAAQALGMAISYEVDEMDEVEDPLDRPPSPRKEEGLDLSDRCWFDEDEDAWMTDFPPPAGFTGYESRPYDEVGEDERYERACTEDEAAILQADTAAARAADRAEDEQLRDAWFALLRGEIRPSSRT